MNKYYTVLGLPTSASKDEIRRKYRQLVLIWHPDKNSSPGAAEKFMQINEAYEILIGERSAPRRSFNVTSTSKAKQQPQSRKEQERDKRLHRDAQLREKFENIRRQHLNAPDSMNLRMKMYREANLFFVAAASVLIIAIAIPLTIINAWNLVWTVPVAIGAGMQLLWRGGRRKLRADMIYSGKTNYSTADIREFFATSTGFKYEAPSGDVRWP